MVVEGALTHPCPSFAVGKPTMVVVRVQGAPPNSGRFKPSALSGTLELGLLDRCEGKCYFAHAPGVGVVWGSGTTAPLRQGPQHPPIH